MLSVGIGDGQYIRPRQFAEDPDMLGSPVSASNDGEIDQRLSLSAVAQTADTVTTRLLKRRFQQPAPSLLSLPRLERSLGTKPVFTQGVESEVDVATALTRARQARLPSPWTGRGIFGGKGRESEKAALGEHVWKEILRCAQRLC